MFRTIANRVWAFDAEWVPDRRSGELLYGLTGGAADALTERQVLERMWQEGGATAEDPMPFLKTVRCRVVSLSVVSRTRHADGAVSLALSTLPSEAASAEPMTERQLLTTFLDAVGTRRPQLVGFNSRSADVKILLQRALINGVSAPDFCRRPEKPWEGIDYFVRGGEWHIDMLDLLGGWGHTNPSLHELATLSGIPGKMDVQGEQVASLWLEGRYQEIIDYNECDALTTYLVWLRLAHLIGLFPLAEYGVEQQRVRELLQQTCQQRPARHLEKYLLEWERLSQLAAA